MKSAKSYEEQLDILEKRGLYIEDREKSLDLLSNVNYYNLTGYLFKFKDEQENYIKGVSFEQAVSLYNFDREVRSFLSSILIEIEQSLKTKVAHAIAMSFPDNPCMYESEDFFKYKDDHERFIKEFQNSVKNNRNAEFVKHHIERYEGHFPIWVAVQLFTLGNIKVLYSNISGSIRKKVSSIYETSPQVMESWINCTRILRNLTAHNMRLYGSTFYIMPKIEKGKLERSETNQLWGYFLLLRHLYHNKDAWIEKSVQFKMIIEKYSKFINLDEIGFPEDWFSKITKNETNFKLKYEGKI